MLMTTGSWAVDMPPSSRKMGQVIHKAEGSEEDAWRTLLQSGEVLAEEFNIPFKDLRISEFLLTAQPQGVLLTLVFRQ